jgi:hypothetical protein
VHAILHARGYISILKNGSVVVHTYACPRTITHGELQKDSQCLHMEADQLQQLLQRPTNCQYLLQVLKMYFSNTVEGRRKKGPVQGKGNEAARRGDEQKGVLSRTGSCKKIHNVLNNSTSAQYFSNQSEGCIL